MQQGQVISCCSAVGAPNIPCWRVQFSYQLDSGGNATGSVLVGNGLSTQPEGYPAGGFISPSQESTAALWASPTSTITVPAAATPGTSNAVMLNCPPQVRIAMFGLQS